MKFLIGEMVTLSEEAVVGKKYFNADKSFSDILNHEMYYKLKDSYAVVTGYTKKGGYVLDNDAMYFYYDDMLKSVDKESDDKEPYSYNSIVEDVIYNSTKKKAIEEIDKALDNGDEEVFKNLSKIL